MFLRWSLWRMLVLSVIALPLSICVLILFPATSYAHAILLRSDPAKDAILSTAPTQVRMWFTEDLNPATSTARVLEITSAAGNNKQIDNNDAHTSASDTTEMDLTLQPNLSPAAYVVVWRTQSADDGHVLTGSFLFRVANADGSVPVYNGALPGGNILGTSTSNSGQLDGPTLFNVVMITLVELGVVFWVGAQLWHAFVLQSDQARTDDQQNLDGRIAERFARKFALPTLLLLLIANLGVLIGQGLLISGGRFDQALAPSLLWSLISSGRFGLYWSIRVLAALLALALAGYTLLRPRLSHAQAEVFSLTNLLLALAMLIAMTFSGHAASVTGSIFTLAVVSDLLHLLAAALWVGGMIYLALVYLPVAQQLPLAEQGPHLLKTLARFTPLAIAGVVLMAVSGPLNATVHLTSLDQLWHTAYGRTLLVKIALVGALLLTSAFHVFFLRPRLATTLKVYALTKAPATPVGALVMTEGTVANH